MIPEALPHFKLNDFNNQSFIALTYDDGLLNHFKIAAPLHLKYGIPATFAVIAGRLIYPGYWVNHVTPWQVVNLSKQGFEIASHGFRHGAKYPDMTDEELETDLADSQNYLQGFVTGKKVRSICIPFSSYDQRVQVVAEKYYDVVRIGGNKRLNLSAAGNTVHSFSLQIDTSFSRVKEIIDRAVASRYGIVLMLHGVHSTPPRSLRDKLSISSTLLEETLGYIASFERCNLLPIRLCDIRDLRNAHSSSAAAPNAVPTHHDSLIETH